MLQITPARDGFRRGVTKSRAGIFSHYIQFVQRRNHIKNQEGMAGQKKRGLRTGKEPTTVNFHIVS